MQALGLGKVSCDKQWKATTSNDTITADPDERNQRRSQQEAPKPCNRNPLDTREAMATFRPDATGRPCWRTRQECREAVMSVMTKLIPQQQSLSQRHQLPRRLYAKTNRRPFLTRKPQADRANACPWSPTMQVLGTTKTKTISKNKCSRQDSWNTCHTRNTPSTKKQKSRPTASRTPSSDIKTSTSGNNNNSNTILLWWDS